MGEMMTAFTRMMQTMEVRLGGGGEQGSGGGGGGGRIAKEMDGKAFENHKKLKGGDAEWREWAADFRVLVETRSEVLGRILQKI